MFFSCVNDAMFQGGVCAVTGGGAASSSPISFRAADMGSKDSKEKAPPPIVAQAQAQMVKKLAERGPRTLARDLLGSMAKETVMTMATEMLDIKDVMALAATSKDRADLLLSGAYFRLMSYIHFRSRVRPTHVLRLLKNVDEMFDAVAHTIEDAEAVAFFWRQAYAACHVFVRLGLVALHMTMAAKVDMGPGDTDPWALVYPGQIAVPVQGARLLDESRIRPETIEDNSWVACTMPRTQSFAPVILRARASFIYPNAQHFDDERPFPDIGKNMHLYLLGAHVPASALESHGTIGNATVFRTLDGQDVLHLIITTRLRQGNTSPSFAWRAEALDLDLLLDAYALDVPALYEVLKMRAWKTTPQLADTDLEQLLLGFRPDWYRASVKRSVRLRPLLELARSSSFAAHLAEDIRGRTGFQSPSTEATSAYVYRSLFSLAKWGWGDDESGNPLQNDRGQYVLFRADVTM
jgi:hypothetical protein